MKLIELARLNEDESREYLETLRWPDGPVCPKCGNRDAVYRLNGKSHRKGLLKCGSCREPFSVTVGTIMESTRVPLVKWLLAFHLFASSKKGFSAHQLHRTIGVTYKTAWFMGHRIRHAMQDFRPEMLGGEDGGPVEVDETYVGGKPRYKGTGKRGRGTKKVPVLALVERGGKARATVIKSVKPEDLRDFMESNIDKATRVMTDEAPFYRVLNRNFLSHETVNHSKGEYVRGDASTNEVESFFALIKRQHYGTHHHYSRHHMPRYIAEHCFRWNHRTVSDETRRDEIIKAIEGSG